MYIYFDLGRGRVDNDIAIAIFMDIGNDIAMVNRQQYCRWSTTYFDRD